MYFDKAFWFVNKHKIKIFYSGVVTKELLMGNFNTTKIWSRKSYDIFCSVIHSSNIFRSCSQRLLLFQERTAAKSVAQKPKTSRKEIVIYLKLAHIFYDIGSEDCFYVLHFQRPFINIHMQLLKWILSKKNSKKKIAVNIWSTDSLPLIVPIREGKGSRF